MTGQVRSGVRVSIVSIHARFAVPFEHFNAPHSGCPRWDVAHVEQNLIEVEGRGGHKEARSYDRAGRLA
jgi:hypothetical protein